MDEQGKGRERGGRGGRERGERGERGGEEQERRHTGRVTRSLWKEDRIRDC